MRVRLVLVGLVGFILSGSQLVPAQPKPKDEPEIKVPYVPTPEKVVQAMLKLAAVKQGDTVYDLGCGDGRIAISAVKDFQARRGLGIDFNPERLKDCQDSLTKAKLSDAQKMALTFKQGDVLKMTEKDFEGVDVVTLTCFPM